MPTPFHTHSLVTDETAREARAGKQKTRRQEKRLVYGDLPSCLTQRVKTAGLRMRLHGLYPTYTARTRHEFLV